MMRVFLRGHHAGDGWVGRMIARFTFGRFKHTSGCFDFEDGRIIGFQSNSKNGVHFFEWEDGMEDTELFEVICTQEQAESLYRLAQGLCGAKYDFAGIWGFLRRKKKENPNKYFCSELWSHMLDCVGIELHRLPAYKQSPVIQLASVVLRPISVHSAK